MAVRELRSEKEVIYFITFTCYNWLPLFEITKAYDSVYKWFEYMKKYETRVVGYVIMPNHLHLMLYLSEKSPNVNVLIANGKRFLAYEIVRRLEAGNELKVLERLSHAVKSHEKKHGKKHRVFEPSFDAKICNT
jgi:REP element-mobilizing transposase RayT